VELLREAVRSVPAGERAAFWRDYVQADSALAAVRGTPSGARLEAEVGR
jgi:hypothetical protein